MSYRIFSIHNFSLTFPQKVCFEDFSAPVFYGDRIAIIGQNGSGKSSLLNLIQDLLKEQKIDFGVVPQIIQDALTSSGGERFNKALTSALALDPQVLLLDEPTNHLDGHNRHQLFKLLQRFKGTLIVASHDVELLRVCVDHLWHIDQGTIHIFSGNYDDYMTETQKQRESQLARLFTLEQERKKAQAAVQFEQKRAASSKNAGKDENDRKLKGAMKEKGSKTEGKKKGQINAIKSQIETTLQNFRLPEVIRPKFSISAENVGSKTLVSITNGEIGYDELILKNINFSCFSGQRIALKGKNGSGKSTLLKAILGSSEVKKTGEWYVLSPSDIGFLDQHYRSLDLSKTVIENLENQMPHWTRIELRKHLNDFLFRSNEEVSNLGKNLSGGERARLSLALIAAKTPKLLILDEITNNLDLETRNHVIDILKNYPGAMMIVSHDDDFLKAIGVDEEIDLSSMAIS